MLIRGRHWQCLPSKAHYTESRPPCQQAGRAFYFITSDGKCKSALQFSSFLLSFVAVKKFAAYGRTLQIRAAKVAGGNCDPRPQALGLRPRVWGLGSGSPRGGGRRNPAPTGTPPQPLLIVIVPRPGAASRVRGSILTRGCAPLRVTEPRGKISTPGATRRP